MNYCKSPFQPERRKTIPVQVGNRFIGGDYPILVQSMVNTNTRDISATVEQILELANAGCELVRVTAPVVKDAEALEEIVKQVRAAGCDVPLSADIHFQPRAAMEAVKWVEKVRINPGNYVDKGIMHLKEWTDEEWAIAEQRVFDQFSPLVLEAKSRGVALRIGTNHGSLSGRMVYRFGDTVEGMVESALEYLRVCEYHDFHNIVFSMKASNPKVVIEAYRLLAARLDANHRPYPFHVGVTEAGEGEDGRLKSAVGIGALLLDGISDTIRVSLTEHPVVEVPVARDLLKACELPKLNPLHAEWPINPFVYNRRKTQGFEMNGVSIGGEQPILVGVQTSAVRTAQAKERPVEWWDLQEEESVPSSFGLGGTSAIQKIKVADIANFSGAFAEVQVESIAELELIPELKDIKYLWSYTGSDRLFGYRALVAFLNSKQSLSPIVLRGHLQDTGREKMQVAAELGALLCDGIGDLICLDVGGNQYASLHLAYDILQASGMRRTKTEFISCPSCGRTLFDLEEVTARIKERTGHLKDVAIAVMGCIVNGPGEMADADFGYVGGAPNKIQLYVGKELVQKNIPEAEATDALVELIKKHGRWIEPETELT